MKKIFGVVVFALIMAFYFLISSDKKPVKSNLPQRSVTTILKADALDSKNHPQGVYEIIGNGDSLIILSDKGYFVTDRNLSVFIPIVPLDKSGTLYHVSSDDKSQAYFDVDNAQLIYRENNSLLHKKIANNPGQAIFHNNLFYYSASTLNAELDSVSIHVWDPQRNLDSQIINLNVLMKKELAGNTACAPEVLEGVFFKVSGNRWGYLFYNAGRMIIGDQSGTVVYPTIDGRPFKRYQRRQVDMGGQTAFVCKAESDAFFNYSACAYGDELFVLSGVIDARKELNTPIDVYDLKSFKYKHTLQAPLHSRDDYAISMAVVDNYLFLNYTKSHLMRFRLSK